MNTVLCCSWKKLLESIAMFAFGDSLGSMAEVASLTSELDVLRGKKSPGAVVNLLLPYFASQSNEFDNMDEGKESVFKEHLV